MNDKRDKFTELHSRVYGLAQLGQALVEAKQQGKTAAILFTDIDRFKTYNCNLGHLAGDVVILQLVDVVQRVVGDKGTACRFGSGEHGDEFLVVLPSASTAEAKGIAKQICDQVAKQPVDVGMGKQAVGAVTLTIGIASYPTNGQDAESLLLTAEEAVWQSKKSGRRGTISTA